MVVPVVLPCNCGSVQDGAVLMVLCVMVLCCYCSSAAGDGGTAVAMMLLLMVLLCAMVLVVVVLLGRVALLVVPCMIVWCDASVPPIPAPKLAIALA